MHTQLERIVRGLSATERMAALVGALVITAMLSAIIVDRWLSRPAAPVVITMAPSSSGGAYAAVDPTR